MEVYMANNMQINIWVVLIPKKSKSIHLKMAFLAKKSLELMQNVLVRFYKNARILKYSGENRYESRLKSINNRIFNT